MRTVEEVYEEYKIMPSLQLHQLRVAAVAKRICENFSSGGGSASGRQASVDEKTVILACLFHDMGNIIKSDLRYFPEFVAPEGLEYWQKVKEEFVSKYSTDHHHANVTIAKEIGLPEASVALIGSIGFSQIADVVEDASHERKIVQYADLRVGPRGVLSLSDRLLEGRKRYLATRSSRDYYESDKEFERLLHAAEELEQQVASHSLLLPEDITDALVAPLVEELRKYPVA